MENQPNSIRNKPHAVCSQSLRIDFCFDAKFPRKDPINAQNWNDPSEHTTYWATENRQAHNMNGNMACFQHTQEQKNMSGNKTLVGPTAITLAARG